jgi:Domain of unknown function (DUF222)
MAAEVLEDNNPDPGAPTPMELRDRPWHVLSGRLNARLDELVDTDVWSMTPRETAETIVELQRAQAKLAAAQAKLLAHAERTDLAATTHATSTAAWLRGALPLTPRQAKDAVHLARALESGRYPATAEALAAGELLADQAQVVVAAVDALPDLLTAEDRLRGEAHLVELGRSYDARRLRLLGRHLLEVVDPEVADEEIAKRLEAEEEAAARATSFTLLDDGQGKAHGRFTVSSLHGEMLKKLLHGFANPQIPDAVPRTEDDEAATDGGRRRLTCVVMGDALVRLIESYPIEKVPSSGGLNATVVVTMQLETLQDGLRRATVAGSGVDLSGAAARRLACSAGVIPAVLGGRSRVLDLGRRSRLASPAQRLAKVIEQEGLCAIEHCDRPASWADAHHWRKRWADGGRTDLDDLILICPRHHTLAHLPRRTVRPSGSGKYRIHRQT